MNVSLGSVEIDEPTLRLINRAMNPHGRRGRATRNQVKAWAILTLTREVGVLADCFAEDHCEEVPAGEQ